MTSRKVHSKVDIRVDQCRLNLASLVILMACFAGWYGCGGADAAQSGPSTVAPEEANTVTTIADEYLAQSLALNPELTYFMPVGERIHDRFSGDKTVRRRTRCSAPKEPVLSAGD